MPFGSNTVTYKVRAENDASILLGAHGEPKSTRISPPVVEPPQWWSEYLLEEWKRKNGVEQKRRDRRTGWQRDRDEWDLHERNYNYQDGRPHSTGMAPHRVWE